MGVYGYGTAGIKIPEGYLQVKIDADDGRTVEQEILYPANPGSVYHMTKTLDQLLFAYYNKNDRVKITDLHQGIVWGTQTEETRQDERLINRFDYDGDYGTVLNRFLMQAAIGYPLTVHGTGGQTRAFINIQDTVRCIELAVANPPQSGGRVNILNQMTETHRVRDLAHLVAEITGATVDMVANPRAEADENDLFVENRRLLNLGLEPITLSEGLLREVTEIAKRYADRADRSKIPCRSLVAAALGRRGAEARDARRRRRRLPPRAEPDPRDRRAERLRPAPGPAAPARAGRLPGLRRVRRAADRRRRRRVRRAGRAAAGAAAGDDLAGCRLPVLATASAGCGRRCGLTALHPAERPAPSLRAAAATPASPSPGSTRTSTSTPWCCWAGSPSRLAPGDGCCSASAPRSASFAFFFALGYGARLLAPLFARPAAWRWLDLGVGLTMWLLAFWLHRSG